jgi:hypothetical protein
MSQRRWKYLAAALALVLFIVITVRVPATSSRGGHPTDKVFSLTEDSTSTNFRMNGGWQCLLDGTFGGAAVSLQYAYTYNETLVPFRTFGMPSDLIGATASTVPIYFTNANYTFRWLVEGGTGTDVVAVCSKVEL